MSKIIYLNNHLNKFRKETEFKINLEEVEALAYYDILVKEDKKTTKIFMKCFENKETFKEFLNKIPENVDRLGKFYLITVYWLSFVQYYQSEIFIDKVCDCLEDIEENVVLINSPHFCKKVYHYLMKPEII